MKKLPLSNPSFRYLETSFKEWLDILGYAPSSVYNMPNHVRELLCYMEQKEYKHIKELTTQIIEIHYEQLKTRSHQRRGGGLSNGHLNKHIQALKKFTEYLRKVGRLDIAVPSLKNEEAVQKVTYLTGDEIQLLFKATYKTPERLNITAEHYAAIQSRDRAMLAVYYGCGLRRNEGIQLDLSDINFDQSLIHVRKGKGYKERFVPMHQSTRATLTEYIYDHRPTLTKGKKSDALFLNRYGNRLGSQMLYLRLKYLQYHTDDLTLQEKEIGLHTLRHSIATHLLAAGMKLESISRFLGHSSLESTQVYTHLAGVPQVGAKGGNPDSVVYRERKQPFNNIPKYEIEQLEED